MAGELYGSGRWNVRAGEEQEFTQRWDAFLAWSRGEYPELAFASLLRSDADGGLFISLAKWETAEARATWQNSEGFMKLFSACRELCDDFAGGDFTLISSV